MIRAQGHKENMFFFWKEDREKQASAEKKGLEYYPFGSLLPGRNFSSDSYRYGFQGQEKDDEVFDAVGTIYSYEYRMHDARIGRFMSIDPLAFAFPWNSPYAFSENRVIDMVELEGLEAAETPDKAEDPKWGLPEGGEGWTQGDSYDAGDGTSFKSFKGPKPNSGPSLMPPNEGTSPKSSKSYNGPSLSQSGPRIRTSESPFNKSNFGLSYTSPTAELAKNGYDLGMFATGAGLMMTATENALKTSAANTQFRYATRTSTGSVVNSTKATQLAKIELQSAAKIAKTAGRAFGLFGVGITAIDAFQDSNITLGETTKIGIGLFTTFTPMGWAYGALDLGVSIYTGKSLTDKAAEMIDKW